ncbi:MAG: ComF family protein [Cyanobacteriota bacterium]|nr:ComF family protein [Cyanobacteriota bacterium]
MILSELAGSLLDWLSRPTTSPETARTVPAWLPGLSGSEPLRWWAASSYDGAARSQLLRLRDQPDPPTLEPWLDALIPLLRTSIPELPQPAVVPVPSWKRKSNPLPALLADALSERLGWEQRPELLRRSRPVLGQHHLGREMRIANQQGAFLACSAPRGQLAPRQPLLLVDDILTTGATAGAAAAAMSDAGWRVAGLICLARTPAGRRQRRDLGSKGRHRDRPG